jgi:integrase
MAQLRKQDLHHSDGRWMNTITPEAGTVKNKERRDVPLHKHLVELGFPEFVERSAKGHLFVTPAVNGNVLGPLQGVKNRVTEFVRTVATDRRVAPNHGWRHRFKTVGRDVGIDERVLDAICGHAPSTVGGSYGDVGEKAMMAALARFPRYNAGELAQAAE